MRVLLSHLVLDGRETRRRAEDHSAVSESTIQSSHIQAFVVGPVGSIEEGALEYPVQRFLKGRKKWSGQCAAYE